MIILDERKYLRAELEANGFELHDFFENHHVLSLDEFKKLELKRRADFLLVDTQTLLNHPEDHEIFKSILNTFVGSVFFYDEKNIEAKAWIENQGALLTKIVGEYSLPMSQISWTILTNQMQFFWNLLQDQKNLQTQMAVFSQELDKVLQDADTEMKKAKKIHETLIPRRTEEIKGVIFSNRYQSGDGGGGEFYDIHQTPAKVYQILLSSQSYLISSAILGILETQRSKEFNPQEFIKLASAEIETINGAKKKKSAVDLLILELDMTTLSLTALTESKADIFSLQKGKLHLTPETNYALSKGEKLIVLSPGFLFNWQETSSKDILELVKEKSAVPSGELMSELLFQLNDHEKNDFFKKDATVVVMEVNRHGIHKV